MYTQTGRVAVVTGAGRGIGRLVALRLAADGFSVGVLSRSATSVDATVDEIVADGGSATGVEVDVCSQVQVVDAFARISELVGPPVIVVNCAQSWGHPTDRDLDPVPRPLERFDEVEWDHTYQSGLKGTLYSMLAAHPTMVSEGWGRIVNFCSPVAEHAAPGYASYTCAKQAIIGLSRTAAREWGHAGITVNCVSPLVVDDGGRDRLGKIEDVAQRESARRDLENRLDARGLEYAGRSVAAAVAYLVSEDACFVTGSVVQANGGLRI